jgi:hypothetical protein
VIDLATPEGQREALAKKKNKIAIATLTMAFTTQGLLAMSDHQLHVSCLA